MRGDISPLESVGEHLDVDIDMDDNDPTMHVSPAEGNKAPLATDPNTARDELEKSGNFSRRKIRKIMANLPKPSTPNDPLFQPTWIPSHEVDLAFAKLYPKAMYKFASPPAKLPTITRTPSQRSPKTQSPQHPSYRHSRRNAIVPDPGQEPVRRRKTGVNKSSASKSAVSKSAINKSAVSKSAIGKSPISKGPAKPCPATRAKTSSPFMDLPGELRNRIYFYSLVRPQNIEITAQNWPTHQPALLKTCKQIRFESLSIFYNENSISANIHDYNPVVKNVCQALWGSHSLDTSQFSHYFTGKPHWENLLAWLKAFSQGDMRGISDVVNKPRSLERKTIGVMFLMATMARTNGMSWEHLEEMLLAQKGLLVKGDKRWSLEN